MVQAGGGAGFRSESTPRELGGGVGVKHLNGYLPIQSAMVGAVYFSHRATAEALENLETAREGPTEQGVDGWGLHA